MSPTSPSRLKLAARRVLSFLTVVLSMGLPLQAQPLPLPGSHGSGWSGDAVTAAARQLSLQEILARHYEAIGGDRRSRIHSTKMTGTSVVMGMEAPYTRWTKRPNKVLLEIYVEGMTGRQAFDGETAWWFMPFMGQPSPEVMPADAARQMRDGADFDGPLVDAAAKGNTIELLGTEPVNGADAYKLEVTLADGSVQTHWLDAQTFYPVRVQAAGQDAVYTEYQIVDGFPVAKTIEINGQMGPQTVYVDTVEFNVEVEDAAFRMR